jgi:pyruvate,water dikinase
MELIWLGQPACHNLTLVGGKVSHLSGLAADYPVPPGFCLTTTAFDQWALTNHNTTGIPPAINDILVTAYHTLAEQCQVVEPSVAVRSSAVDEDGLAASFAGQYETYLNIKGVEAVAKAVARCWASVHSARVQAYRRQQNQSTTQIKLAVLIQQLIAADIAAVVFSANPVTGNREEIVINASWGLGESIVGGTVTPDTYVVRKSDLTITKRQVAQKQFMTIISPNGTREVTVPRLLREQPAMSDTQAIEMAQLAWKLETNKGWAVDIECAYQAEKLYLLQCRPITMLANQH